MLYWSTALAIQPYFPLEKQTMIIKPTSLICIEKKRLHYWDVVGELFRSKKSTQNLLVIGHF
jgi:hypothetical protein